MYRRFSAIVAVCLYDSKIDICRWFQTAPERINLCLYVTRMSALPTDPKQSTYQLGSTLLGYRKNGKMAEANPKIPQIKNNLCTATTCALLLSWDYIHHVNFLRKNFIHLFTVSLYLMGFVLSVTAPFYGGQMVITYTCVRVREGLFV